MKEQIWIELKEYLVRNLGLVVEYNDLCIREEEAFYCQEEAPSQVLLHAIKPRHDKSSPQQPEDQRPVLSYLAHRSDTDIEEYLKNSKKEDTFSSLLFKYIDQTGLPDSDIYKKAGIDRRHFSKIRCNKDYRPKKETAMTLCLALKLNLRQAEELLEVAGYSLSSSDTGDLIIKFCIERGIYDLLEVNEALVYFGGKALGVMV